MPVAGTVISPSDQPRQLSDGNDQGTTFGLSPNNAQGGAAPDKIGFFGNAVAQPSGNAQAALARGQNSGMVMSWSTLPTLTAVTALQSAEYNMTLTTGSTGATMTLASTDLLIVNKPTQQSGLGVGNVRYKTATQLGLTFSNFGTLTVTPTASQIYSFIAVRGLNTVTAVLTPAAVAPATTAEQIFTVTGVRVGECVMVNKPSTNTSADIAGVRVVGNNQVGVTFVNVSATTVTPTAGETYTVFSTGGIDAVQNHFLMQIWNQTPVSSILSAVTSQTLTSANILIDDTVIAVQKPTLSVSVGLAGGFVSAANTMKINSFNPSLTSVTPAAEIYTVGLMRPNMLAPCIVYTATLTPSSVAANTTAEQTFAVTGIVAGTSIVVNKPSSQAGLGIMGARVSSAGNIAITFCNATATTITPTAAEVYTIANFQAAQVESALLSNNTMVAQPAAPAQYGANVLVNAVRNAAVSQGLIAGA